AAIGPPLDQPGHAPAAGGYHLEFVAALELAYLSPVHLHGRQHVVALEEQLAALQLLDLAGQGVAVREHEAIVFPLRSERRREGRDEQNRDRDEPRGRAEWRTHVDRF